jgi:tetratricopeptide (TPR) repeat protein
MWAFRGVVGVLLLSLAPLTAEPPARPAREPLEPVPLPDLKRLEPAVARQIESVYGDLQVALRKSTLSTDDVMEAFGLLGQLFHAYELFDAAAFCYRDALRLVPGDYRWLHLLADVENRRGAPEEAREQHEAALAARPNDVVSLVELGEVCLDLNLLEESERRLREALKLDPSSAAARAGLGRVALARRDYAGAVPNLEAALRTVPEATRLHYSLGMALRGLGKTEEARRHLALTGSPGIRVPDPLVDELSQRLVGERAHTVRGRLAYGAKRYRDAVAEFESAVAANPNNAAALVDLGAALAAAGDNDGAIKRFEQAIELAPENATAHLNLGQLLVGRGRSAEAVPHLRMASDALARDPEAQRALAEALQAAGQSEEALRYFAMTVRLNPLDEDAVLEGASLLVKLGRYREARSVLEAANRRMPEQGRTSYALAHLLAACPDPTLRDGQRALDLATRVYRASPTPRHARTVALALAELGRCREAADSIQPFLDPSRTPGAEDELEIRRDLERYRAGAPCRLP